MKFTRIAPDDELSGLIECYWMMADESEMPRIEKIVPDGFTEIIFNYGGVYRSDLGGSWQLQTPNLLAGQINSFFHLQNVSTTASFAVKLKPAALTQLFGLDMALYVDKIVDLDSFPHPLIAGLSGIFLPFESEQELTGRLNSHFLYLRDKAGPNPLERSLR